MPGLGTDQGLSISEQQEAAQGLYNVGPLLLAESHIHTHTHLHMRASLAQTSQYFKQG